jgi:hypothetical protein
MLALTGALGAAGFARTEVIVGPPEEFLVADGGPHPYRAYIHAYKS